MCYSVKKKLFILPYLLICVLSITSFRASAQIDPFALTPIWHFGNRAGLDFTSGSPILLGGGQVNGGGQEGSSSICDPSKALVFYTDGYRLYNSGHSFIQNLNGGTSSTQNSVIVPDPADPSNRFYLFTANVDHNGAGDKPASNASLGIHYYHIQKNAGSILVLSGPVQIAAHAEVSEQLCSGTDGNGNYWVVAHEGGHFDWQMNKIWAWKVTTAGVGAKVVSTAAGKTGNNPWQGSLKINKCQTKLAAVFSTGVVEIFDWDPTLGQVTGMPQRIATGLPAIYGCEFSPDGSILYFTALGGNMLYQLDIASGTIYSDATWTSSNNSPEIGTMQLGPDNKIYVLNASNFAVPCYLGVVNNPNTPGAGCNYVKTGLTLNSGPGSYPNVQRGISNIAWLSPDGELNITNSSCPNYSFSYSFQNYFLENISIVPNSEEWDFGDGGGFQTGLGATPSHAYAGNGTYTVRVRMRDAACNRTWTFSNQVSPNCVLPVEWIYVNATHTNNSVLVSWATAAESNNSHFIVERSEDGVHFEAIGNIKSNSVSTAITEYSFTDINPLQGNGYYRIRQVDLNGTTTYSTIVTAHTPVSSITITPNPSTSQFTLHMPAQTSGTIKVYDLAGKEILSSEFYSEFQFGEQFSPGTYIVKIIIKEQSYCEKLIKDN